MLRSHRLHTVAPHQSELCIAIRRLGRRPQLLQVLEVAIQSRGVKDEETSWLFARIPEGVRFSRGDQHKHPARAQKDLVGDMELHGAVQDEVGLVIADMAMRRRHSATGRKRPLHQREPTLSIRRRGLEPHLAPTRLATQALATLPKEHRNTSELRVHNSDRTLGQG